MSTDKELTGGGMGDRPVLFGPANDPALADRIEKLTGAALEGAIARLSAYSDDVFGDEEDEKILFATPEADGPEGTEVGIDLAPAHQVDEADEAAADGLDRILDTLSDAPDPDMTGPAERPARSLFDVEAELTQDEPVLEGPTSPIAEVIARSAAGGASSEADYIDPELQDLTSPDPYAEEEAYDPLSDLDGADPYEEELGSQAEEGSADEDLDLFDADPDFPDDPLDDPDLEPDFPDEGFDEHDIPDDDLNAVTNVPEPAQGADLPDPDLPGADFDLFGEDEVRDEGAGAESGRSYGLPEPTPYGDQDAMGGLYGSDDEPDTAPVHDEAGQDPETTEDWLMSEEEPITVSEGADPAQSSRRDLVAEPDGSALDGLIKDLSHGSQAAEPAADQQPEVPAPASGVIDPEPAAEEPEPEARRPSLLPAFLRRDSGRPRLGELPILMAMLAAASGGAWLMTSGPAGPVRVADAGGSTLAPLPEMGAPTTLSTGDFVPVPETGLATTAPSVLQAPVQEQIAESAPEPAPADISQPAAEGPVLATGPDADPASSISPEVADLMSELNRGAVTPAAPGASSEELAELRSRLADMEAIAAEAQGRSEELSGELTSLTDQITGLLQRDSDQAERLDRMERLIRGQSAIMAQFGQMEESLEQTQVVLLDVSARIGAVEGQNPADRDAVNRALADIEGRIQALTANMSILARMSIEGVDALRAPNASAGSAGVQTAPAFSAQPSGGSDTVFRTETGGFRISSDAAGRIPPGVKKDDFIEGYGYVLDVLPASDGQRLVVMENGSVLIPAAN